MSEGKLLVPRELLESLDFGKDMKSALASLPKLRALLAQPSDGALTNGAELNLSGEYHKDVQDLMLLLIKEQLAHMDTKKALTNEGAEPVAWADPKAFKNFKAGVATHEWMWAFSDGGLVPLYLRAPASVVLPPAPELPEEPPFADDDSYMDAYHAARRMRTACAKAIAAAGLKVEP